MKIAICILKYEFASLLCESHFCKLSYFLLINRDMGYLPKNFCPFLPFGITEL